MLSIELPDEALGDGSGTEREITCVDDGIGAGDDVVVAANEFLIHFFEVGEWAAAVADDVLMPEMFVSREKVHLESSQLIMRILPWGSQPVPYTRTISCFLRIQWYNPDSRRGPVKKTLDNE